MQMLEKDYLADMYRDPYFPDFLVDKIKTLLKEVVALLESGESDLEVIQAAFDKATIGINELEEEFDDNDSEIETAARESIGETVDLILTHYKVAIDCEEAIREREW
ncbi:hypothetical protein HCJ57_07110 [Listeria booriae]|uniref:Uncharacterized protein n=2 Tax=Listeria booriae TaxID=1552123 RepID=A0A7X0YEW7_9LIST|nr:hypothetical protein [Listeria booriae]MBC1233585.1 hypothetical protein [Listeria booriae]MBC1245905.1 hypothetical protein [Listeria booriae]MBC1561394.1 hypothetical protein [Listeria booriae]MBC1778980.1 hypothetical protein [Listeria booriae]